MTARPLLVFDFDGVIIDGMQEYWYSARRAYLRLTENPHLQSLPEEVPHLFCCLRPWVHYGWEMVLIASEIARPSSHLNQRGLKYFCTNYSSSCQEALRDWDQSPERLQNALDSVRRRAIESDRAAWLKLHRPFPGVVERLLKLEEGEEDINWAVLTTKSTAFTAELLGSLGLVSTKLYGREDGSKLEVLLRLASRQPLVGLIEDRRATLETVRATKELHSLYCYLASWGYLRPEDHCLLPTGIHLLSLETLATPFVSWP
ncbi:HAD family hydrolase [cyanobiont of Ornithocercus magnificus]|nr:HAD family hydrolase [cyanobiont of Ornithocercus magnificus]